MPTHADSLSARCVGCFANIRSAAVCAYLYLRAWIPALEFLHLHSPRRQEACQGTFSLERSHFPSVTTTRNEIGEHNARLCLTLARSLLDLADLQSDVSTDGCALDEISEVLCCALATALSVSKARFRFDQVTETISWSCRVDVEIIANCDSEDYFPSEELSSYHLVLQVHQ